MKSCLFLVVGVLLVEVLWAQDVEMSCSTPEMILCEPKGVDEVRKNVIYFPDADILNRHCDAYVRAFECLVDYEKACLPEGEYVFGLQGRAQDLVNLVKDVCDKDSLVGKGYREHVDCLNTHGDDFKKCFRNGRNTEIAFNEYLQREHGNMTQEDNEKVFCLVNVMLYTCMDETVQKTCGEEARGITLGLFDRIRGPVNPICTAVNMVQIEERFAAYLAKEAADSRKK